jgi:hypothetical protein
MAGYSVTEICKQLKQFSENQVKYVSILFCFYLSIIIFLDKHWNFFRVKVIFFQQLMMIIFVLQAIIKR